MKKALPFIKKTAPLLFLISVLVLIPDSARADSVLSLFAFGISWLISSIAAIAVALEAWLLGFILSINLQIVNSAPVKFGFPVSLALANLGFVLAIIVIAIATILRNQTYNVKQILWKLIVMAIMVNFGLVIAGSILTFTDQLSLYFLSGVDPAGSVGGATSGAQSVINFASAVGGAFQPQKLISLDPAKFVTPDAKFIDMFRAVVNYATGNLAGMIGAEFLSPLATIIFTIFFQVFIIITLGTLIAMLLVRYVYLGFLLVLLPLAWVCWVFPAFEGNYRKWWDHFLRQAFFAPIVLFFLWLAMQTSEAMRNAGPQFFQPYISESNIVWAGISQVFTNILKPFIEQFLHLTVVLGVMLGGIAMAHGMGIKFADAAQKAAYGVGKSFGGYVGRRGLQAGTSIFRGQAGRKTATNLQQVGAGWTGLAGGIGRLATIPIRRLGRGMEAIGTLGGERAMESAKERQKGMSIDQKIHGLATMSQPEAISALKDIDEAGRSGEVQHLERYLGKDDKEKEGVFKRYNQTELLKQLRGNSGLHLDQLRRRLRTAGTDAEKTAAQDEIVKHLRSATNEGAGNLVKTFFQDPDKIIREKGEKAIPLGMSRDDMIDMQNLIVKQGFTKGFSPSNLAGAMQKLTRGDQLEKLKEISGRVELRVEEFEPRNLKYIDSSGARSLFGGRTVFGFPDVADQRGSRIVEGTEANFREARQTPGRVTT